MYNKNDDSWMWFLLAIVLLAASPFVPAKTSEEQGFFSFLFGLAWRLALVFFVCFVLFCTGYGFYSLICLIF